MQSYCWCVVNAVSEVESLQQELPFVYGGPKASGVIRATADDFFVDEDLGFEPDGQGHHVLLHVEKRDTNTQWLANQIARHAQVPVREVGYAGLKDRHAVTRQWFSVHLAGREVDWTSFNSDQWRILSVARHQRKLRPGFLRGNRFTLVVRDLVGDYQTFETQLQQIKQQGVPNYFGEQRFGYDNLARASAWMSGQLRIAKHNEKSMLLSSLRSALFNKVLAERVSNKSWCSPLDGDLMMLAGTQSVFLASPIDDEIERRLAEHDISPTGPLFGRGKSKLASNAAEIEEGIFAQYPEICAFLIKSGLDAQRRRLISIPADLTWEIDAHERTLTLSFALNSGCYATGVLHEIVTYSVNEAECDEAL